MNEYPVFFLPAHFKFLLLHSYIESLSSHCYLKKVKFKFLTLGNFKVDINGNDNKIMVFSSLHK